MISILYIYNTIKNNIKILYLVYFFIKFFNITNFSIFIFINIIINIVEETKFQIFIKKLKFCFHHLLIHPFLDLTILGISYRIIYLILKITGFL